jgi:hypothetical protein
MAKSMFTIGANWSPKKQSIIEISVHLWSILKALASVDDLFLRPVLSKENYEDVCLEISQVSKETAVKQISSAILEFSKSDILQYEKEKDPSINYSRDFGFSLVISYRVNEENVISFVPRMGSIQANGIGTLSFAKNFQKDFLWYHSVLRSIVTNDASWGAVGLRETPFNKSCKNIIAPLGWITYFSKDFKPEIPNDLQGIEYEHTDTGKYLILTREDFTTDKETYEAHKQKLLNLMEEIKRRVPGYSK